MTNPLVNINVSGRRTEATSQYKTVILKASIPFAEQVMEPNTKYVIKYDFDLDGGLFDVDLTNAATHSIGGINYYYIPFTADGRKYTLQNDNLFFIDAEWNGLSAREIKPAKGTMFMIGSITSQLYHNGYAVNAVTVPENCVLQFDGGSLRNGVLAGNDTYIVSTTLTQIPLVNITLTSTFIQLAAVAVSGSYNDLSDKPVGAGDTRPVDVAIGYMFFDATLGESGEPIWHAGNNVWVDATGATV